MVDRHAQVSVDGHVIPPEDIATEAQNHPADTPEAAWIAAAEALVIRRLLLAEADRLGIVAASDLADAAGRLLAADDARIEMLLEQEVQTPRADDAAARRFHAQHARRFASPTIVEAEHILFLAAPEDAFATGLAMGDARHVIRQLQADPARFAELAHKHSACPSKETGGNLGQIGPGQTVGPFEKALFALSEGELCAEPVKTRFGVHVIRAGRRVEGQRLPFEAVAGQISTYLEEASFRRAAAQYLAILAARAHIEGVVLEAADGPLVQ